MIDEKKLIDQLKVWMKLLNKKSGADNTRYELLEEVIDLIEEQPELDVPDTNIGKWIPVTERLPDDDLYVLVCCRTSDSIWIATRGGYNFLDLKDVWVVHPKGYFEKHEVIAWMPLPVPYKGGKKNEID